MILNLFSKKNFFLASFDGPFGSILEIGFVLSFELDSNEKQINIDLNYECTMEVKRLVTRTSNMNMHQNLFCLS